MFKIYFKQTPEGRSFLLHPDAGEFLFMRKPSNEEGEVARLRKELHLNAVTIQLEEIIEEDPATKEKKPTPAKKARKKSQK